MKHFFKYDSGYINVDTDNLYLTNTGNWQEARGLHEKSKAVQRKNNARITKMKAFVYTFLGTAGSFLVYQVERKEITIGIFVLLAALAWKVFDYFKHEFGVQYKIPINKITAIEKLQDGLKIFFLNANDEPDYEIVNNVDKKGIEVLIRLKAHNYDLGVS